MVRLSPDDQGERAADNLSAAIRMLMADLQARLTEKCGRQNLSLFQISTPSINHSQDLKAVIGWISGLAYVNRPEQTSTSGTELPEIVESAIDSVEQAGGAIQIRTMEQLQELQDMLKAVTVGHRPGGWDSGRDIVRIDAIPTPAPVVARGASESGAKPSLSNLFND